MGEGTHPGRQGGEAGLMECLHSIQHPGTEPQRGKLRRQPGIEHRAPGRGRSQMQTVPGSDRQPSARKASNESVNTPRPHLWKSTQRSRG